VSKSYVSEIALPILRDEGEQPMQEKLPVEQIGPGHFRLLHSPGLVEGLAAGDVIELTRNTTNGYKLVQHGGNVCVWFFVSENNPEKQTLAQRLNQDVIAIGGWLDGGGFYSLIFTIPVNVGFPNIERIFNEAVVDHPGSTWMYGNVYDSQDGLTPLNWWQSK